MYILLHCAISTYFFLTSLSYFFTSLPAPHLHIFAYLFALYRTPSQILDGPASLCVLLSPTPLIFPFLPITFPPSSHVDSCTNAYLILSRCAYSALRRLGSTQNGLIPLVAERSTTFGLCYILRPTVYR